MRLRQLVGVVVHEYPRTIAFSGISMVKLKWGAIKGSQPVDDLFAIRFERVGRLVEAQANEQLYEIAWPIGWAAISL